MLLLFSERDLIGMDAKSHRLLYFSSAADVDEDEGVELPLPVLQEYPRITFETRLLDTHAYILKKWVVQRLLLEER